MTEQTSDVVNVICMKWGTKFGADDVNILHSMVQRHLRRPHRFICLTDNSEGLNAGIESFDIPQVEVPPGTVSPWRKLGMFSRDTGNIKGWSLFLDLDVVIMGGLDDLFDFAQSQDKLTIIENWTQPGQGVGNSSVYVFEWGRYPEILDNYHAHQAEVFAEHDNEQIYFCKYIGANLGGIAYWPEDWCQSFKVHSRPPWPLLYVKTPSPPQGDCRVLVFHGNPGPVEALKGGFSGNWRKYNKPAKWIAKDYQ